MTGGPSMAEAADPASKGPRASASSRTREAAVSLAADWLGGRFFRTFRLADGDPAPFDARFRQRDREVGVTVDLLWDEEEPRPFALDAMESLVGADLDAAGDEGGFILWAPPGAALPEDEPLRSDLRLTITRGPSGLQPIQRRE